MFEESFKHEGDKTKLQVDKNDVEKKDNADKGRRFKKYT